MVSTSELRAQKHLIIGISLGVLFGIVGNMLVTTLFRVIDILGKTSVEREIFYFVVAFIAFIILLIVTYLIVRDINKKSK